MLEKALALKPQLARGHFFLARVLRQEGKYDEAVSHLQIVLTQYPRDRVVRNELGRDFTFCRNGMRRRRRAQEDACRSIRKICKRITT